MRDGERRQPAAHAKAGVRTELILENSADGILAIDSERRILAFNAALEGITGWSRDEAIGRYCYEVFALEDSHGANLCQTRCPVLGDMRGLSSLDGILSTRDGRRVDVALRYSVPSHGVDTALPVVVNVRDTGWLAGVEALNTTLLAMTSHELQTPISIIKAYASTLARSDITWDEETIREKLRAIEEESDRLSELVSRLLYVSRLDSATLSLNRLALDLPMLVHRVVERVVGASDRHEVEIDFPADFPPVDADPEKLEDVLINLVENAVKFSPRGGTVTVKGEAFSRMVRISVSDEGIGVTRAERDHIFDRFYRGHNALLKTTQGVGLGLHICKVIVEAHGGRIWAQGRPGRGSRFLFTLPRAELEEREHPR